MAMTAEERYNIALNIVSRVGVEGDVIGEFSKAMSRLNAFSTMDEMETQGLSAGLQPQTQPPMMEQPPVPPTNGLGGVTEQNKQGMI